MVLMHYRQMRKESQMNSQGAHTPPLGFSFEEGGFCSFWASRKEDSSCLGYRESRTLGVWVFVEGELYGFKALAANEKRIPNEFPKGLHSSPRF